MAEYTLEDMDEDVVVVSRAPASPLHDKLRQIQEDPELHRKVKKIASFKLPQEKGKAHQQKQNMTNVYGNSPSILGFSFSVTRAVDNSAEYLGVKFDPTAIVPGAYEEFEENRKARVEAAKARKAEREKVEQLKVEARAEIEHLNADNGDE